MDSGVCVCLMRLAVAVVVATTDTTTAQLIASTRLHTIFVPNAPVETAERNLKPAPTSYGDAKDAE